MSNPITLTKTQFDKTVKDRKFPVGSKVFVQTSQRAGLRKKLAKPFKGPFTFFYWRGLPYESVTSGDSGRHPLMGSTRSTGVHHAVTSEKPVPPFT